MFELDPRLAQDGPICENLFADHLVIYKRNRTFPWLVVVPKIAKVSELYELSPAQRDRLFEVVATLSQRFKHLLGADKLNIEMLGNQVPQLHVHLIARFRSDVAWPNPIWKTPLESGDWWTDNADRLFELLAAEPADN